MDMRFTSVTCVLSGKMANRDAERGLMSPWISPPFRRNISATCSSRTPIRVAVDEEHRRRAGLQLVGADVVPFRRRGEEPLDELRKVVRSRAQLLVLGFNGRAIEGVHCEFRERVEPFLDHALTAEPGRNDDHLSHFVRMADRTLHCHGAAHAVTDEVRAWDFEVIEQRRHIVGEIFVGDVACDVRRAPMALHFDGNHFPRFGELADPPGPRRSVQHRDGELVPKRRVAAARSHFFYSRRLVDHHRQRRVWLRLQHSVCILLLYALSSVRLLHQGKPTPVKV